MSYAPPFAQTPIGPLVSGFGAYGFGKEQQGHGGASSSATWSLAKRVIYVPVYLPTACIAVKVWWANGSVASTNNIQVGVYTSVAGLPNTKLVACASTLAANANVIQVVDITDSLIPAGPIFLAMTADGTTARVYQSNQALQILQAFGILNETTVAFGLPTTATPIALAVASFPVFGFSTVATI